MRDKVKNDSDTIHVKVIVTETISGYTAEYDPKVIDVDDNDAILSFRLVAPTPDNVIIDKVTIKQLGQDQLSKPTISNNGKRAVLMDENTVQGEFNLQFTFKQKKASTTSLARTFEEECTSGSDYPIVVNNPP